MAELLTAIEMSDGVAAPVGHVRRAVDVEMRTHVRTNVRGRQEKSGAT
jgi:hypothetical protein